MLCLIGILLGVWIVVCPAASWSTSVGGPLVVGWEMIPMSQKRSRFESLGNSHELPLVSVTTTSSVPLSTDGMTTPEQQKYPSFPGSFQFSNAVFFGTNQPTKHEAKPPVVRSMEGTPHFRYERGTNPSHHNDDEDFPDVGSLLDPILQVDS